MSYEQQEVLFDEEVPFSEIGAELFVKYNLEISISYEALDALSEEISGRLDQLMEKHEGENLSLQESEEYLVVEEEVGKAWSSKFPTETLNEMIKKKAEVYGVSVDSYTKKEINEYFSNKAADILHDAAIAGEVMGEDEVTTGLLEQICDIILDKDEKFPLFC